MTSELKHQLESMLAKIPNTNNQKSVWNFFTGDIKNFNEKINNIDQEIISNRILIDKACLAVNQCIEAILQKAQKIEGIVEEKTILKQVKHIFREMIKRDFIDKSFLISRGYNKPSGYPGDYKLIEIIYDNTTISKGVGICGDNYMLQKDNYVGVIKTRKDIIKNRLIEFVKNSKIEKMNIMNLGCGSCREIREILESKELPLDKELIFTLVDWDKEALGFSKEALNKYSSNSIEFNFIQENIINLYKTPDKYSKLFGEQNLIYSIGLVDYLPNLILGETISFCFNLLKKKGILMLAHKNIKVHKSIASDWFCDWSFSPRSKEDVFKIIIESAAGSEHAITMNEDNTGHLFFVNIEKA